MKVITIESEAYKRLVRKIECIHSDIKKQAKENAVSQPDPSEVWVNDKDAAAMLQVSKRTMQRLRSNGEITYSIHIMPRRSFYSLSYHKQVVRMMCIYFCHKRKSYSF